jgi:hypothetical protein
MPRHAATARAAAASCASRHCCSRAPCGRWVAHRRRAAGLVVGRDAAPACLQPAVGVQLLPTRLPAGRHGLVGPQFAIHNANTALERFNFLTYLLDWGGSDPDPNMPNAVGTRVNLDAFAGRSPATPSTLVDHVSRAGAGQARCRATPQQRVITRSPTGTAAMPAATGRRRRVRDRRLPGAGFPRLPGPALKEGDDEPHNESRRCLAAAPSCAAAGLAAGALAGAAGLPVLLGSRHAHAADYKALVCVFQYGGSDGMNMVVPTDTTRHGQYAAVRGGLALPRASLVRPGGQPVRAASGDGRAAAVLDRRASWRRCSTWGR